MNGQELAQVWKDPDRRDDDVEHPAGEIALSYVGGNEAAPTDYLLTAGCNCGGGPTNWDGTCTCSWSVFCCTQAGFTCGGTCATPIGCP